MEKYLIKKKYGQNFIKDQNIIKKILEHLTINKNDLVIEIGPGQGDMTRAIINNNCFYIGYEIDQDLSPFLNQINSEKQKIIYADFLQINISDDIKNIPYEKLYIVGNLPYYITTPIIKKIISEKVMFNEMLIMVQKEVADRFCSSPNSKKYGSITVFLKCFYKIEKVMDLKNSVFFPKPKVDSSLLKFTTIEPLIKNEEIEKLNKLLKDSFQFKRKTIKNNLFNYDLNIIEKILIQNSLSLQSRAEEISVNVFIQILRNID